MKLEPTNELDTHPGKMAGVFGISRRYRQQLTIGVLYILRNEPSVGDTHYQTMQFWGLPHMVLPEHRCYKI